MKYPRAIGVLIVVASLAAVLGVYVLEATRVDTCLDHGGSFDYAAMQCGSATTYPYSPFSGRHKLLLSASLASIAVGVTMLIRPSRFPRRA